MQGIRNNSLLHKIGQLVFIPLLSKKKPNHFALSLLCSNFVPFYQEQGGGRGAPSRSLSFPYIT